MLNKKTMKQEWQASNQLLEALAAEESVEPEAFEALLAALAVAGRAQAFCSWVISAGGEW